jgi:flagellar biosynthesis/type III secretory pathway protein FliH
MLSILKASTCSPRLVDRLELEARERGRALVAEAEEAAARIRAAAETEREEALRAAVRAGREEGLATAGAALLAVAEARQRRLEGLEREIAAVALEVVRKLIGVAVAERPELVAQLALRALEPVRSRREVLLRANPVDAPLLRAELPRLAALLDRAPGISVREDPCIEPGGVVVETEAGRVDARVEAQLSILERLLGEGLP